MSKDEGKEDGGRTRGFRCAKKLAEEMARNYIEHRSRGCALTSLGAVPTDTSMRDGDGFSARLRPMLF